MASNPLAMASNPKVFCTLKWERMMDLCGFVAIYPWISLFFGSKPARPGYLWVHFSRR